MRSSFDGGFSGGFGVDLLARSIVLPTDVGRVGDYVSPGYDLPVGATLCCLTADIGASDRGSTKSFRLALEASSDGGQTWRPHYAFGWTGPSDVDPWLEVPVGALVGQRVRAVLSVPAAIEIGASVEVR